MAPFTGSFVQSFADVRRSCDESFGELCSFDVVLGPIYESFESRELDFFNCLIYFAVISLRVYRGRLTSFGLSVRTSGHVIREPYLSRIRG